MVLWIPFRPHVDAEMAAFCGRFCRTLAIKNTDGAIQYRSDPGATLSTFSEPRFMTWKTVRRYAPNPAYEFRIDRGKGSRWKGAGGGAVCLWRSGDCHKPVWESTHGSVRLASLGCLSDFQAVPSNGNERVLSSEEGKGSLWNWRKRMKESGVESGWELSDLPPEIRKNIQVIFRRLPNGDRLVFLLNMDEKENRFSLCFPQVSTAQEIGSSEKGNATYYESGKLRVTLGEWGWTVLTVRGCISERRDAKKSEGGD